MTAVSKRKRRARAAEDACPKCGCPELMTCARAGVGTGLRVVTTCPACSFVINAAADIAPEPPAPGSMVTSLEAALVSIEATRATLLGMLDTARRLGL